MRGAKLAVLLVSTGILLVALTTWMLLSRSVSNKQTIPVKHRLMYSAVEQRDLPVG